MYDEHYGLTGRPFQLTPDPAFWFDTATHRKAMAYLGYGLSQGEGFIVITGEPGTGKTTLVGHLMATVDMSRLNVIRIVTTQIDADDLLRLVASGLDVDHAGLTKAQLLAGIERGLHAVARSGRRTLLIVDEAQSLPVASIEELRMLSNFQAGGYALLQIFLLGQPEFRERLHGSDRLEQLRQRVIAMHHLDPMGVEEVEPYLAHRLSVVGWTGRPDFTTDAVAAMHHWSGGIPRRLNQLASRVMLYGAIEGIDRFEDSDVRAVATDMDGDGFGSPGVAPVETIAASATGVQTGETRRGDEDDATDFAPEATSISGEDRIVESDETVDTDKSVAEVEDRDDGPADDVEIRDDETVDTGEVSEEQAYEPWPMTPAPPPMPPRPISLADADDVGDVAPAIEAEDDSFSPVDDAEADDVLTLTEDLRPVAAAQTLEERTAAIEARLEEQDAALRRVLTLLVDWVEGDARRAEPDGWRDGTRG